jgi:hypothetical protein
MGKSPLSLARMSAQSKWNWQNPETFLRGAVWFCGGVVCLWLVILSVQVALRCAFPWDLFVWAESPFLTDMLKLDQGKPIYGPVEDGNSFVYSPGLTYLIYALLKPLGLHLDIRYCRIITVAVAVLASVVAGFAMRRAITKITGDQVGRGFILLGMGLALLVIFKNFNADIVHPDNLVMLHTAGLLWLTLRAVQEKSFGWAVATMLFAGVGVFAKQTLCVAFLGPALVFLRFRPWEWGKTLTVGFLGVLFSGVALAILWAPENAKFYTWEVLTAQKIHLTRFYWMGIDFVHADRALLLVLAVAAAIVLLRSGAEGRNYVQIWLALGIFSVAPGALAFVKHFGTWNNLIIHQLWLFLLVWPALGVWLARKRSATEAETSAPFSYLLGVVLILFVGVLLPVRYPMDGKIYAACEEIQNRVTADIAGGKRVMVAHGTMYQLRAGSQEIPLDRANSIIDLMAAGFSGRVKTAERIRAQYYDRLYLAVEDWYDEEMRAAIHEYYQVDAVIKKPDSPDRAELGRSLLLIGDCLVMSPKSGVSPGR